MATHARNLVIVSAVALLAALMLLNLSSFRLVNDDAFISFRYAQNLAAGKGAVYNAGERVEGYTNPLFVLIAAGFVKAGIAPEVGMVWLCVLLGLSLLPLAYFTGRLAASESRFSWLLLIAPLLIAVNRNVAAWCVGALEAVPLAALVLASTCCYLREHRDRPRIRISGILYASCYLLRPDAVLFAVAAAIHSLVYPSAARRAAGFRSRLRATAPVALPVIAIIAAHTVWRRIYYHAWLPNTFYAKTGGNIDYLQWGLAYVNGYLQSCGGYAFYVLPVIYLLVTGIGSAVALYLLSIGLYGAFVVAVGGDYGAHYRLLVPLIPLVSLMWQESVRRLWYQQVAPRVKERPRVRAAAAALLTLTVLALGARFITAEDTYFLALITREDRFLPSRAWRDFTLLVRGRAYWMEVEQSFEHTRVGRYLGATCPARTWLAVFPAGRVPYYSGLPSIDMMGLSDRHIARAKPRGRGFIGHEKHDGRYVVSREPDIIICGTIHLCRPGIPSDPRRRVQRLTRSPAIREMVDAPGFWRDYRYALLNVSAPTGYLEVFLNRKARVRAKDVVLEWPGADDLDVPRDAPLDH